MNKVFHKLSTTEKSRKHTQTSLSVRLKYLFYNAFPFLFKVSNTQKLGKNWVLRKTKKWMKIKPKEIKRWQT